MITKIVILLILVMSVVAYITKPDNKDFSEHLGFTTKKNINSFVKGYNEK